MARSNKPKRTPKREIEVLAKSIGVPVQQTGRGDLVIVDVQNHTEDDQRRMTRSKQMRTVRRFTRVELLTRAGVITAEQALACEWFSIMHELAFEYGQGTTANYSGVTGCGGMGWDHSARSVNQGEARANVAYATLAIPDYLVGIFMAVVLGPLDIRSLTKGDRLAFSLAAFRLHEQIAHLLVRAA